MEPLDGNAIGGVLFEALGSEMTDRVGTCRSCGRAGPIAQLRVYFCGPSAVARCPECGGVVIVVVQRPQAAHVDLHGLDLNAD
jgi:Family of unknown function (DUF6510)